MLLPILKNRSKVVKWLLGIAIVGTLGTAAGSVYLSTLKPNANVNLDKDSVEVKTADLTLQIPASGVVQAVQKSNVSPKEGGRLVQLLVKEGDRVEAGQVIARMDDQQLQAQVSQYRASLAKAKADLLQKQSGERPELIAEAQARVTTQTAAVQASQAKRDRAAEEVERYRKVAAEGAITRSAFGDYVTRDREAQANLEAERARLAEQQEALQRVKNGTRPGDIAQAEADVAQAIAQLKVYETQLDNTVVRAPFAGIISRRFADTGDYVAPMTTASTSDGASSASIAELSSGLEIEAKIPEANISRIKIGQLVDIKSDGYGNEIFKGAVTLIAPRATQENNVTSFRVKIALQTGQEKLKAGMNVRLALLSDAIANTLAIPLAAIVTQKDGQKGVWLVGEKGAARFQVVQLGAESSTQAQVLTGLKQGDRIFLSPPPGAVVPGVDTIEGG